ncbi:hypothetical protein C4K40_1658 [Pseudomonas sp. CMR5c]|nr:hypothetical protein C4K40_1658 [Pseudomonas sp. CMR5c]
MPGVLEDREDEQGAARQYRELARFLQFLLVIVIKQTLLVVRGATAARSFGDPMGSVGSVFFQANSLAQRGA